MNKKITITITKENYDISHKKGAEFTSVSFQASTYGKTSPCNNQKEVEDAIRHCKEWIVEEGDIPVIDNQVEKRTLNEWL